MPLIAKYSVQCFMCANRKKVKNSDYLPDNWKKIYIKNLNKNEIICNICYQNHAFLTNNTVIYHTVDTKDEQLEALNELTRLSEGMGLYGELEKRRK